MSRARSRGFTLIEILVAVSLLALMVLGAMAALSTSVRAVRSGEALVTRTDSVRIAQQFLRQQLSQAMALPFERSDDLGMVYVFEGDDTQMKFVAPMPGHLARGGPHVQIISISRSAKGQRIEFSHALLNGYDSDSGSAGERPPVLVLDGLASARFEYRTVDENGEATDWLREWDNPQFLPMMVRLVAEFPRDRPQRWAELEIPVMAGSTGVVGGFYNGQPSRRPRSDRESDSPQKPTQ
ncbi:prepilin-type N-terminal cleavage/methylation domain-containing protein [Aquimonas sp.]|jgi:general secretion pathway protein J|uniref:prepilin-type N-terminal cleavage/methylation domain-containing protein n=1 Tax=Aquimonas sp. TaxID=1872588 RepID=UPI0037BECD6F